jgi:hypothetical protein
MIRTNTTNAPLPRDFHAEPFDEVNRRVAAIPNRPDPAWEHFATAWNTVAYRFVAAGRADDRFGEAYRRGDRARQELSLFAFLSAACSAVECGAYAIYAIGAILEPKAFPLLAEPKRKDVKLGSTAKRLERQYPGDPLSDLIRRLRHDRVWLELVDWRDVEIHRGTPARSHSLATLGAPPPPNFWRMGIHRGDDVPLGSEMTHDKRKWLARTINELVAEVDRFLTRRGIA